MQDSKYSPHSAGERRQPVSLIVQLMQSMTNMSHVDEVLLWLSEALVQHLDISVIQFWAAQLDRGERSYTEVRAIASQNPSLPQQVSVNHQVASVINLLLQERRSVSSLPVENVFSPPQAALLARHNLRYWCCYFLKSDALLPLSRMESGSEKIPTPLTMAVSIFSHLPPPKEQERAISFILEQALRLLVNRNFLISPASTSSAAAGKQPGKQLTALTFADIILRRSQDIEAFQADNPFANATIIADKNARRLYAATDGSKTMSELMKSTSLGKEEAIEALRYLLHHQKIQVFTLGEKHIDNSLVIDLLS